MKRKLLFALLAAVIAVICTLGLIACADNGANDENGGDTVEEKTYDDLAFILSDNGSYYKVAGASSATGKVEIPATYKGKPVTEITEDGFKNNKNITSVTIPESITYIGTDAFLNCENLKDVRIKDVAKWCNIDFSSAISNPLYYAKKLYINNRLVTELVIPEGVANVKANAFVNIEITGINVSSESTQFTKNAFDGCTYGIAVNAYAEQFTNLPRYLMKTVVIKGGKVISDSFSSTLESITIPDTLTTIKAYGFRSCTGLKEVRINSLENWCKIEFGVDSNPLSNTQKLYVNDELVTDLVIPDTVTSISASAFQGSAFLKSVNTGNGVKTIGEYAFSGCSYNYIKGLESVTIGNSVTTIGEGAFKDCLLLKTLKLGNKLKNIEQSAFQNCEYLQNLTIPNSVTTIEQYAFDNCKRLTSVTIPDSVTTIDDRAFSLLSELTSLTIGNGVKEIGTYAFYQCPNLTSFVLGSGVNNIHYSGFHLVNLEKIYYNGTEQQWNKINLEPDPFYNGNQYFLGATKFFYSAEEPTDEGNYWHYVDGKVTEW